MASRQRLATTMRREWLAEDARGFADPGFRAIVTPGPQEAPGDETILGPETQVDVVSGGMIVGSMPGGGYVVAYKWDSSIGRGNIFAYDGAGNLLWSNIFSVPASAPLDAGVTGLVGGGGAVVWRGSAASGDSAEILLQRFDEDGGSLGNPVVVNTLQNRTEAHPRIVPLDNGGFVVVWGTSLPNGRADVRGQLYDAAGAPVGGNFALSTATDSFGFYPVIDAMPDGGFVVAWFSQAVGANTPFLSRAQRFDAAGQKIGPEVLVSERATGQMDVAALSDGGLVVVWHINNATSAPEGAGGTVYARRFDRHGNPQPEGLITVISTGAGKIGHLTEFTDVSVEGLDSNHFLVTWVDARTVVSTVFGRVYNAVGQSTSGVFVANQIDADEHLLNDSGIALIGNDTVAMVWSGRPETQMGSTNVYTRRFAIEVPDAIMGTPGLDNLPGTANSDLIYGLASDDMIDGGLSADRMEGGLGSDTYIVDNVGDQVAEDLGGGTDTIFTTASYTLGAGAEVEVLSTRNNLGTEAIVLIGNAFAQTLVGNAGANILNGLEGIDVMAGLAGDDTYVVDRIEDQVLENLGGGNDTVFTSISYVLSSNQEIETLSVQTHASTDNIFLTGNQLDNIIIGNAGNNTLNGVNGADTMYGLAGDDTYAIDNAGDLVIDGFGQGNDLVLTYLSHTLSNGNEIETLSTVFHTNTDAINLGGNDYNNTLIGNYGANYINGGGGVDHMVGLNGDDTYVVDNALDTVEEIAGGGTDTLFSFVSYTLAAGQQVEVMSTAVQGATASINLTGNELGQTIVGGAGFNILDGRGGDDTLHGLGGADVFAFRTALGSGNVDTIADFQHGLDMIGLDRTIFTAIDPGFLNPNAFVTGSAAADADDRIIYNSANGQILYDADGTGAGGAILFAIVLGGVSLAASDFGMP